MDVHSTRFCHCHFVTNTWTGINKWGQQQTLLLPVAFSMLFSWMTHDWLNIKVTKETVENVSFRRFVLNRLWFKKKNLYFWPAPLRTVGRIKRKHLDARQLKRRKGAPGNGSDSSFLTVQEAGGTTTRQYLEVRLARKSIHTFIRSSFGNKMIIPTQRVQQHSDYEEESSFESEVPSTFSNSVV